MDVPGTFCMRHSIDTALIVAETLVTCRLYVVDIPVDAILGVDALSKLPCFISLGSHRILSVLPDCISYNNANPDVDVTYIGKTQSFDKERKQMCDAVMLLLIIFGRNRNELVMAYGLSLIHI